MPHFCGKHLFALWQDCAGSLELPALSSHPGVRCPWGFIKPLIPWDCLPGRLLSVCALGISQVHVSHFYALMVHLCKWKNPRQALVGPQGHICRSVPQVGYTIWTCSTGQGHWSPRSGNNLTLKDNGQCLCHSVKQIWCDGTQNIKRKTFIDVRG